MRRLQMLVTVTLLPTSRDWSALRIASEIVSNLEYEGYPASARLLRQGDELKQKRKPTKRK